MANDPNIQADLQSAGVQAPQAGPSSQSGLSGFDPASLLQALSRGPMAQAQQNPMMSIAAGLQGYASGFQGTQNPLVSQVNQQEETHRRSVLAMHGIMEDVRQEKAARENTYLNIAGHLAESDVPEARAAGWKARSGILQQSGFGAIPQPVIDGLAKGTISKDKFDQATYLYMAPDATDEQVSKVTGINDPMALMFARKVALSEPARRKFLGKTPEQEAIEAQKMDIERQKADAGDKRNELMLAKIDAGQAATEARMALADSKEATRAAEAQQRLAISERNSQIAQGHLDVANKRLEFMTAKDPQEKAQKALDHAELFVNQLQAGGDALNKLGFLPKGSKGVVGGLTSGDLSPLKAQGNRMLDSNNPEWINFTKHLKGEMIGYSRSVQNDIGPRTKQAFDGALAIMDNPPSMEAINKVVATMRQAIQVAREGKDTAQQLLIRKPDGSRVFVPWKRGMSYDPGDVVERIE